MCDPGAMEVLQALGRPMQLLLHFSRGSNMESESRTNSSLLTKLFLINIMMFPPPIHSDTVTNSPSFSSWIPLSFKMLS